MGKYSQGSSPHARPRRDHPYYKESHAAAVKAVFNHWIANGRKPLGVRASLVGLEPASLQQKFSVGLAWLAAEDPESQLWEKIRDTTVIRKTGDGIILMFKEPVEDGLMSALFSANAGSEAEERLKTEILEWIASAPPLNAKFHKEGISPPLSESCIHEINGILGEVYSQYQYSVLPNRLLIIRDDR